MKMEGGFVVPPIYRGERVKGFFTTKGTGVDRKEIACLFGVPEANVYMPIQQHTDRIAVIDHDLEPVIADAAVTLRKDIVIGVKVADCVPVLIFEKMKGIVAAVHAGWRGTAAGILKKTMQCMIDRFHAEPGKMIVAIGPSIGRCSYGVDYDVMHAVSRATGEGMYHAEKGGKYFLDLPSANRHQAISMGVPGDLIWVSGDCTFCNPDRYYSYRYAKGATGRQGGFISRT
jgi:YfiH family protein